jgi:hypothetical protein
MTEAAPTVKQLDKAALFLYEAAEELGSSASDADGRNDERAFQRYVTDKESCERIARWLSHRAEAERKGASAVAPTNEQVQRAIALLEEVEERCRGASEDERYVRSQRLEYQADADAARALAASLPQLVFSLQEVRDDLVLATAKLGQYKRDYEVTRCQKCGEQALPSPTFTLDIKSDLHEAREELAVWRPRAEVAEQKVVRLEAEKQALIEGYVWRTGAVGWKVTEGSSAGFQHEPYPSMQAALDAYLATTQKQAINEN